MKKFILFLFATLILQPAFAQKKLTKAMVQPLLVEAMADFTESVQPYYQKGMTVQEFEIKLLGKDVKNNSKPGKELIYKAFRYIESGTSRRTIIATDNGVEMAQAYVITEMLRQKNPKSTGSELFGIFPSPTDPIVAEGSKCRWYQLGCHLRSLSQVMVHHGNAICLLAGLFNVECNPAAIATLGELLAAIFGK